MPRTIEAGLILSLAFVISFMLPLVPCSGQTTGTEINSDIDHATVWTLQGSPYHVTFAVTVLSNASLSIQGGAVVKFDRMSTIIIKGSLVATGVTFTSASLSPNPGDWPGLSFQGANQGQIILDNIKVTYASTDLEVQGSKVTVKDSTISKFAQIGISVSNGGTINITNSVIMANQGAGIDCKGTVQAYQDTIIADRAVWAESSCTGTIDASILTANTYRGVEAASDTTLVVQNSLINSTSPDVSYGVYAETGSKIVLKGDDIVGHVYCIYTETASITVQAVSVRNFELFGVFSNAPLTVTGSFAGDPKPVVNERSPAPGNEKVTFDSPLAEPFDIAGISQPPSVLIISPARGASVNGKVTFTGRAWEPDKIATITKVEIRILNEDNTEVVPWTTCDGTGNWKFGWNLKDTSIKEYKVYTRVTSSDGEVVLLPYLSIESNPYGSGYNPFSGIMTAYTNMCYGVVIVIIIVFIIITFYFFFYKKKETARTAVVQPVTQQPFLVYQPQYTPAPQPAATAPVQEEYVIEDVFLIYRDGRLIHHDTRRLRPEVDEDSLSGMFTAIQDFIGQSFPADDGTKGEIKEIMYEDNRIILEHGKFVYLAVMAAKINDTKSLHKRMSKLIKAIEENCATNLAKWDGDLENLAQAKRMTKLMYTDEDIDNYVD